MPIQLIIDVLLFTMSKLLIIDVLLFTMSKLLIIDVLLFTMSKLLIIYLLLFTMSKLLIIDVLLFTMSKLCSPGNIMFVYVLFAYICARINFVELTWERVYMREEFWDVHCLMTRVHRPGETLCG